MSHVRIYTGDCLNVMASMPDASVDAIVTDPPYGLGFMGRQWDRSVPGDRYWSEALRVAKPGAHLLAFGGTRTFHRLTVSIEDAGWEVRECISWIHAQGFPKSHNISKAIDRELGAEPRVVGRRTDGVGNRHGLHAEEGLASGRSKEYDETEPATPEAAKWAGWGTALKPAWEPIIMARAPIAGTIAANVIAHGTGGINIDGCRIAGVMDGSWGGAQRSSIGFGGTSPTGYATERHESGRFPANLILDEEAGAMLDAQSGQSVSRSGLPRESLAPDDGWGMTRTGAEYDDAGGASRFFFCPKPSPEERAGNAHETVKPVDLMRYLVRLVTPPGGVVLDPFAGSGTTAVAAIEEGLSAIVIERELGHADTIQRRADEARWACGLFADQITITRH